MNGIIKIRRHFTSAVNIERVIRLVQIDCDGKKISSQLNGVVTQFVVVVRRFMHCVFVGSIPIRLRKVGAYAKYQRQIVWRFALTGSVTFEIVENFQVRIADMNPVFGSIGLLPSAHRSVCNLLPLPGFMSSAAQQADHVVEHVAGVYGGWVLNQPSRMKNDFFPAAAKRKEFC